MTVKSGVVALVASVQSTFTARSIDANVSLGWKQPAQQINQGPGRANRVVFIPSDPGGKGGKISGVQQPGARRTNDVATRALFMWERLLVVSVWAVDKTDPHNEALQIEAVETLFEQVVQAVHLFARVNARWGDVTWTTAPLEHQFGRELRASLVFSHPLFDVVQDVVVPTGVAVEPNLSGESG